jgi:hypothetical protein
MRVLPVVAILVFALLAAHPTAAHAVTQTGGPTVRLADSTSVPLELPDGRAVISVALNGRGPYRLAVETGSPDVLLSPKAVAELGLRATGMGDGDSVFRLDSLRIGAALIGSLPVGRDAAFERIGVDGVLGLVAYQELLLTLDYPGQRLSLARGTLPPPDGRDVLAATRVGPFIGIPVVFGGVRETGVIDTQGGTGFQATEAVASQLVFQGPLRVVGRVVVGHGVPVELRMGVLQGDARLGGHLIHQPRIAVHPLPPDIPSRVTIGLDVLRHFILAIDQRTMAVRLTRPDTAAIALD